VADELLELGERKPRMLERIVSPQLKEDLATVGVELLD